MGGGGRLTGRPFLLVGLRVYSEDLGPLYRLAPLAQSAMIPLKRSRKQAYADKHEHTSAEEDNRDPINHSTTRRH